MAMLTPQSEPPKGDKRILHFAWKSHLRGRVPIIDAGFARTF
jgi:hypothetical protein